MVSCARVDSDFFDKVNVLYTKGAFGGRRMSSVVLSARNAVAVYVSDDGTLVMSAKLAFAVIFRFLPIRLSTVALCCVLDAFSLNSCTLCQNIDIGLVCNVACR